MLERLCAALAEEWEIEGGFGTDVAGVYSIPLGDDLEIALTEAPEGFVMSAALGAAPHLKREEFFTVLMAGNFLGQGTQGGVLSLDENDIVSLSQVVTDVDHPREFRECVEDFIDVVDQWKAATQAASSSST